MKLFDDVTPRLVPALRIVLCTYLVLWRSWWEVRAFARDREKPTQILHSPTLDALGLEWPPFHDAVVDALPAIFVVCCALAALGLATRAALLGMFLAWWPMGTLESGFGYFNHTPALPAQLALALAFAPGVTAYSLDRVVLAKWRREPLVLAPPGPAFADVVVLLGVGALYFASGLAKLRWGGVSWLDGSTLGFYLQERQIPLWYGAELPAGPGPQAWKDGFGDVSGYSYLSSGWGAFLVVGPVPALLSWLTLSLELGAPFALLASWQSRAVWCVATALFHVGIVFLMGPGFVPWLVVLVAIFPWREMFPRLTTMIVGRGADGSRALAARLAPRHRARKTSPRTR